MRSAELEWRRNAVEEAISLAQESRRLARAVGDPSVEARALIALASALSHRGNDDAAEPCLEEAVEISRAAGIDGLLPRAIAGLGAIALVRGDYRRAADLFEGVLGLLGDRNEWARATNLEKLALARLHLGELERASALLDESATLNTELQAEAGQASNLLSRSALAAAAGDFERAARLGGAAEARFEVLSAPFGTFEQAVKERTHHRLVAELGEDRLAALWADGRGRDLDEATGSKDAGDTPRSSGNGEAHRHELA